MTKGRILLVEDDKFSGRMMELQFRKHGYDLVAAENAKDALAQLEKSRFDLVLTDVIMPDVSGIELVKIIRETTDAHTLPVVMLSGLTDEDQALAAFKAGANDYVVKSKSFEIILAMVQPHIEIKNLRANGSAKIHKHGRDAVWTWQATSNTMTYSREWKQLLGFQNQDPDPNPNWWLDRVHPEDRSRVRGAIDEHKARRSSCFSEDFRITRQDGNVINVHGFALAMFGKSGDATRLIGSLREI